MFYSFDFTKSLQAAAQLLKLEPGKQMSVLRLMKLLYIADRESLREDGRPITCDGYVAMRHGPVLSHFYDIVKGSEFESSEFARYVRKQGYHLTLKKDPGRGKLNRSELGRLKELSERYRDVSEWDIVEETHLFPEWIKNEPGDSARVIPVEDILSALGYTAKQVKAAKHDAEVYEGIQKLFKSA